MRKVADKAYQQMRLTLCNQQPVESKDLNTALLAQAKAVETRAGFEVESCSEGQPSQVQSTVQRQVLYICREALNNIEKHAHAHHVLIHLCWAPDELRVIIQDDGSGFEPEKVLSHETMNDHYGLAIMRERAEEIHAQLTIRSAPGLGTTIGLRLPLCPSSRSDSPLLK